MLKAAHATTPHPMAMEPARAAYVSAVRSGAGPSDVVAAVVEAYIQAANDLGALLPPIKRQRQVSSSTRTIAALSPGERAVVHGIVAGQLVRHYATARRILGNPDAMWSSATQPDQSVVVTRNEDGCNLRDPRRNAKAMELAGMAVGQSRISATIVTASTGSVHLAKRQARRILGDPTAQWSVKATTRGMRVTRLEPDGQSEDCAGRKAPKDVLAVLRSVSDARRVSIGDMTGPSRAKPIANARWAAITRLHALTKPDGSPRYSPRQIGEFVNRDRTSVLHVLRQSAPTATGKHEAAHAN